MESERYCITEGTSEEREPESGGLRVRQVIRDLLGAATFFLVVFLSVHFSIQNFRIDGTSMSPTLHNEQYILISKLSYFQVNPRALKSLIPFGEKSENGLPLFASATPGYGDVIAFSYPLEPSRELMKRVIGVPGDTIELDRGQVIRNGEPLDEPYVVNSDMRSASPVKVPADSYFVLGDNRPASSDSRSWGFVHKEHIIGRAWLSYWPWDRVEFHHSLW